MLLGDEVLTLAFIRPCIGNIFSEYNQQDATFHNLFIPVRRSTCFRRFFRPSSGAQNCTYSVSHLSDHYSYSGFGTWWHTGTHGRGSEGERCEWSGYQAALHCTSEHGLYNRCPLIRTPRLPVVDWTHTSADLNGLVRFAERPNLVSVRVPSRFERAIV